MTLSRISRHLQRWKTDRVIRGQLTRVESYLRSFENGCNKKERPVIFFNASTRISHLSMNAAFSLLASWAVRSAGVPVLHVVCKSGLRQCMLGTKVNDLTNPPPCEKCIRYSHLLFPTEHIVPLSFDQRVSSEYESELKDKSLEELSVWEEHSLPLGELCTPTLGWALRRYNLLDDYPTRHILYQYLLSAVNLVRVFEELFDRENPRALVVFNGITYPEAIARRVALRKGIPVVTHEVGLGSFSAFFSHDHATFRQIDLPPDFQLGEQDDDQLDAYLESRAQGRFTMAGIKFWPQIQNLPQDLLDRMCQYNQTVVIFTNVIFDTSQVHANTLYEDMFSWLEDVLKVIKKYKDTLFVIRAHPDEDRPGKASRESVSDWVKRTNATSYQNVHFFSPSQYVSSYKLIDLAKFVMVYNSSIGLEASIMGVPVLCAGRARYTQLPTVFFPSDRNEYLDKLINFLTTKKVDLPEEFIKNARKFLYYELFKASLDFGGFLNPWPALPGFVTFSRFNAQQVTCQVSSEMKILAEGILRGEPLVYPIR